MTNIADQNQMLLDIIKTGKASLSDVIKPAYIKDVPKATTWDAKNKRNIEAFITKYEMFWNASGYHGDEVMVRSCGSFYKEGTLITFAVWRSERAEDLA